MSESRAEQLLSTSTDAIVSLDVSALPEPDRKLRSSFVARWLQTSAPRRSLTIIGASFVAGPLALSNLELPPMVALERCTAVEGLELENSTVGVFLYRNGATGGVSADSLRARLLSFARSTVRGTISLRNARIEDQLIASGATIEPAPGDRAMNCYGIKVGGSVVMWRYDGTGNRSEFAGSIDFADAEIAGQMTLLGARLDVPDAIALSLAQARVHGSVVLDAIEVDGEVLLNRCRIGGSLTAKGGDFRRPEGAAINAAQLEAGEVAIEATKVRGTILLRNVAIRGDLVVTSTDLAVSRGQQYALDARLGSVGGALRLSGAVEGEVRLSHLSVNGDLDLAGCTVRHEPQALTADSVRIRGRARLSPDFHATGAVLLMAAEVRDLDLAGSTMRATTATHDPSANSDSFEEGALMLDRASVVNDISLDGATVHGCVVARSVRIGGTFRANRFTGHVQDVRRNAALDLENTTITGNLLMLGTALVGGFRAPALDVSLLCMGEETSISRPGDVALGFVHLTARKRLSLGVLDVQGSIDLREARSAALDDRLESWGDPSTVKIDLDGFQYGALNPPAPSVGGRGEPARSPVPAPSGSPLTERQRLEWLGRQGSDRPFRPGPYDHLARLYRERGEPDAATEVLIEREDARLAADAKERLGSIARLRWIGRWILARTVRHGYRPGRAAVALVVSILAMWALVALGPNHANVFAPTADGLEHADMNPLVFAADTILPIVDFGQASSWRVAATRSWSSLYRVAIWVGIAVGWILSSLLVAATTKLTHSDA